MFMAMTFASSDMVLPAFIQTLTASSVLVGLASAVIRVGWAWPQIFISRIVESRSRKMPLLLTVGYLRSATWFVCAVLTFLVGASRPVLFLICFLLLYAFSTSMMGISNVPFMDIVGKAIPAVSRARVIAMRRLMGGAMAMLAGVVISYVLSQKSGLRFPENYGLLFATSGALLVVSTYVFGRIPEPIEPVRKSRLSLGAYIRSGLGLLKEDRNYRLLCGVQVQMGFCQMAMPFYVPYAISELRVGPEYVGLFVTVLQLSSLLSNVLWAQVGHRMGNRALLVYGSYFLMLAAAASLLAIYVPDVLIAPFAFAGLSWTTSTRVAFFALTFVFTGFAMSGLFTGRMTYVLEIAPSDRRPTYTSFLNTFMLPLAVLPLVAGGLVSLISYWNLFLLTLLFAIPLVVSVQRLEDVASGGEGRDA